MFTLNDFLKSDLIKWYKVLSAKENFEKRIAEHITVIELPVENFVRTNEIVLSSASGCENDENRMLELIRQVAELNACALILTRPNDTLTLPNNCFAYLKTVDLPVILIPWECLFADLIEFVLKQLRDDNQKEQRLYEEIQKNLLTAYLNKENMNCAARIISQKLNTTVSLFDSSGNLKGTSGKQPNGKIVLHPDAVKDSIPIKTEYRLYGYLSFGDPRNINETLLEQYLLQPFILWFDQELVKKYARQKEIDEFIWEIIKNPNPDEENLMYKGRLLGFQFQKPYACVVGSFHLHPAYSKQEAGYMEKWIDTYIFNIKEKMLELAKNCHRSIILTFWQDHLIFYIESQKEGDETWANQYLDQIEKRFSVSFPHILFSWGIYEAKIGPSEFHNSFLHAKQAHDKCLGSIQKNVRYSYKSTAITRLLSHCTDDPELRQDILTVIDPILTYDKQNQSELMVTLQTYLKIKNVSEAAKILHLHRQSLIYRLNKIENLTGMTLKDPDNSFLLEVAVRMFTMSEI